MLRVVACDQNTSNRRQLRSMISFTLGSLGARARGVMHAASPADMDALVHRMRPGFFDLVVCLIDQPSQCAETLSALASIRALEQDIAIVIVADRPDYACDLVSVGIAGYCLIDDGAAGFEAALRSPLLRISERRDSVVGLRFDGGVGSIVLDDIMFVEMSKKGAIVHLVSGDTLLVRQTLQALFEKLVARGNFIKVGGSFIVNLENIRLIGEGSIVFPDGESIIVPVRVRKTVRDTVQRYWLRDVAS